MAITLSQIKKLESKSMLGSLEAYDLQIGVYGKDDVSFRSDLGEMPDSEENIVSTLMANAPFTVVGRLLPVSVNSTSGEAVHCSMGGRKFQCGADFLYDREMAIEEVMSVARDYVDMVQDRVRDTINLAKATPFSGGESLAASLTEFLEMVEGDPSTICKTQMLDNKALAPKRAATPSV